LEHTSPSTHAGARAINFEYGLVEIYEVIDLVSQIWFEKKATLISEKKLNCTYLDRNFRVLKK
jgi:hypothetical protein